MLIARDMSVMSNIQEISIFSPVFVSCRGETIYKLSVRTSFSIAGLVEVEGDISATKSLQDNESFSLSTRLYAWPPHLNSKSAHISSPIQY